MRFVLHTSCVSPHVLPYAKILADRIGRDDFRYLYEYPMSQDRLNMGWSDRMMAWTVEAWRQPKQAQDLLLNTECLYTGYREVDVFEARAQKGLKTFYGAERWFKPITLFDLRVFNCLVCVQLPGWVRMLVPSYRKMAKRFVRWIQDDPNGRVFTIGPWAKKDMLRLGVPELKIVPWGYFVAPSVQQSNNRTNEQSNNLKVLWVGRMIPLKRVDTIIRAFGEIANCHYAPATCTYSLTLVGDGPEKSRLRKFANQIVKQSNHRVAIDFLPFQPLEKVREIMRINDVFVFASNQIDGWGAVVNEALEEGLVALGTKETGASATMLSSDCQFHAGDWRTLAKMLRECVEQKRRGELRGPGIGDWSAAKAAERLLCAIGE